MNKLASLLFVALFSFLSPFAVAADVQAGRDFIAIDPPMPTGKGKVEVIEFFSYGCGHCAQFHPTVSKWAEKLPKDVSFRRVPVSLGRWERLSRIYYALEVTGDLAKLDAAVFAALHETRGPAPFNSDEAVIAWMTKNGVDGKKFGEAFTSFGVKSKAQIGDQDATKAKIRGVPALVVDGKYLVNNEAVSNFEQLVQLTDSVIVKARQERKGK